MASPNDDAERLRQQLGREGAVEVDPYLAGFLARLAAANANKNDNSIVPDASLWLASDQPWQFEDVPTPPPFPPSSPPLSHILSSNTGTHSSALSRCLSLDNEPHESPTILPDVIPCISSSDVDKHLWDFDSYVLTAYPPTLDNHGGFPASDGSVSSSTVQPSLAFEGDGAFNWPPFPSLAPSQHDRSALSESCSFAFRLSENHNAPAPGSATNRDQPINIANTPISLIAEASALIQVETPLDASIHNPRNANSNGEAPNASLQCVARRSRHPKPSVYPPSPGLTKQVSQGAIQTVFRAYGSKRSKFNEQARIRTALTREVGACATCRKKKLRCDQSSKDKFVPCGRCTRLPQHLLPVPCCRVEIIDIKLFRLGLIATPTTLQQWMLSKGSEKGALQRPRRVYLTQDINVTTFAVTVLLFQPGPDDTTAYVWTDAAGIKRKYVLPPYYISDMAEAGANMRRYAQTARPEFTKALLVNSNPIVRKTFQEAERYYTASKSQLVAAALMFWSATRMIERWWLICGTDTLGVPPMKHNIGPCRRNPFLDSIPATPIMDTQLDELAIKEVLIPLKNNLLRLLKTKILAKKKEYWYEIYLTSFIILHNSERVLDHVVDFSRRFGVNPEPKSNDEASLSHAYYHACKTVLVYFHFASGGAAPLSLDWLHPTQVTSIMTQQQIAYLRDIKAEILRQDAQLQALKGVSMYETELYWCHQMLFPGWKADMAHTGKLLEFTEKDFLCS